jgi:hypothetical protein
MMAKMRKWHYATAAYCDIDGNGHRDNYMICSICGKRSKYDYGMRVELANRGYFRHHICGMCLQCAKEFLPKIEAVLDEINRRYVENQQAKNMKGE